MDFPDNWFYAILAKLFSHYKQVAIDKVMNGRFKN